MGELMDALDALDDRGPAADPANPFDQAAQAFRPTGIVSFCCDLNPEDICSDGVLPTLTPSGHQPEDL